MSESKKKMTALAIHHTGGLRLPPCYHLEADLLVLCRRGGSVVAVFSARGSPPR
jgi:hypothetical protein